MDVSLLKLKSMFRHAAGRKGTLLAQALRKQDELAFFLSVMSRVTLANPSRSPCSFRIASMTTVPGCDHPVRVEHIDGVIAYTLNKHTKAMLVAGEDSGMHSYIPLGGARHRASGRVRKPRRGRLVPRRPLLPSDRHIRAGTPSGVEAAGLGLSPFG